MVWLGLAVCALSIVAMQRIVRLRVDRHGVVVELCRRSSFRYVSVSWRGDLKHVRIHRNYGGRMRGRPLPPPPPGNEPPGTGVREPRPRGDGGPSTSAAVAEP